MNLENLNKAITVMERVVERGYAFDMGTWQGEDEEVLATSECQLHECGMPACFGGWLAVSPEWAQAGGGQYCGVPRFNGYSGSEAVADFLGVSDKVAAELTLGTHQATWLDVGGGRYRTSALYGEPMNEITAEHVLHQLYHLRAEGKLSYAYDPDTGEKLR